MSNFKTNEKEVSEVVTRRINFPDHKLWVTTNSFKQNDKWFNTLYVHFNKSDFPNFQYPQNGYYYQSSFADIDFHGGVTFYEESIVNDKTFVKVGCDYQHLGDDHYQLADHGLSIIKFHTNGVLASFFNVYNREGSNE